MSYAIEAFRSRPKARFTKARRLCRNSLLIIVEIVSFFLYLVKLISKRLNIIVHIII